MKASTTHTGSALAACLRAAETDADRFHGSAPVPHWQRGPRATRRLVLATALAVLGTVAGVLLVQRLSAEPATARPAPAAVPSGEVAAPAAAVALRLVARPERPFALPAPMIVDGGDLDTAAALPASVLIGPADDDAPRIAPMNVPTVPDEHDQTPGEPDPVDDPAPEQG